MLLRVFDPLFAIPEEIKIPEWVLLNFAYKFYQI